MPVLFAHAWHETLFPGNQTLKMFNALSGPKRLLLSIGDHSGPEMTGMLGLPNRIWQEAHRWFDRHLLEAERGEAAAAASTPSPAPRTRSSARSCGAGRWNPGPPGTRRAATPERFYLTGPAEGAKDGGLLDKPTNGWHTTFTTGTDTPATVADQILLTGYAELAGLPKAYRTGKIDRNAAGVWTSAPLPSRHQLRGVPRLRLTVGAERAGHDVRGVPLRRQRARHRPHHHARAVHAPWRRPDDAGHRRHRAPGHRVRRAGRPPPDAGPGLGRPVLRPRPPRPPGTITITSPDEDPSYLESR